MNQDALQADLIRLFDRYEVELERDEDWLVTDGDFPAIRASWHEGAGGAPGQLDVDVVISEECQIEESFAGHGSGAEGVRDALKTFERNVLHVLLAACWYVTDDRRIQLQSWELGLHTWDVFAGPLAFSQEGLIEPDEFLPTLRAALGNELLSGRLHWVQLFYRRGDDGSVVTQALLDNQPWPRGDALLKQLNWPASDSGYSARRFIALDVRDY